MPKTPDFFIVGAPKCGTSALYHFLKQHPEIFMSKVKEPHFFSSDLVPPNCIQDENLYLTLFSDVRQEKRIGEASASYLYSQIAAEKIKKFSPNADIIILLRNPVDMMYSLHSQALASGRENITEFQQALNAENERKREPSSAKIIFRLYRDAATYSKQVQRYIKVYGREKVHIIIFDDFRRDTAGTYKKVLQFLDVDDDFKPSFRPINTNRRPRSLIMARVIKRLKPRKGLKANLFHRKIVDLLRKLNNIYEPRPPMDTELQRSLKVDFIPEIQKLSEVVGRDLTFWHKD